MSLSFYGFLEVLGRLADMTSLPTEDDLRAVKANSVYEFHLALKTEPDPKLKASLLGGRPSSDDLLAEVTERPLAEKLKLFLPFVLANMAISFNGDLMVKSTKVHLMKFLPAAVQARLRRSRKG
jgi:hypothetical protein